MDLFSKYKREIIGEFVHEDNFNKKLSEWINKFGDTDQSRKNFIWSIFQQLIDGLSKKFGYTIEAFRYHKKVYWVMFKFLVDEGKDTTHIRKAIASCDLNVIELEDLESDFESVVEVIGNKCCPECDKIDEKVMSVQEAISAALLPYSKCTNNNGCVCCYASLTKTDEKGRLIRKK